MKNHPPTAVLFPIVYLLIPYTALIQDPTRQFAALLALLLVKGFAVIVGFPCITILLTNAAPSVRILGTLNGFATTFSGLGRAVGPAAAGATFSWGLERGYVLPAWWLLAVIAVGQVVPAWMIIEGEGPRREEDSEEEDDEALVFDEDEQVGVAAAAGGSPRALVASGTGREDDDDEDEDDDDGLSPLARVSSRAPSGGYGTISK